MLFTKKAKTNFQKKWALKKYGVPSDVNMVKDPINGTFDLSVIISLTGSLTVFM